MEAAYDSLAVEVMLKPLTADILHPVAASIIAALMCERQVIQIG